MSARPTPTEALLSMAAASTREELHAARLALIETGPAMLRPLDVRGLLFGDGSAGHTLLGGGPRSAPVGSVARRAGRIQLRTGSASRSQELVCERCGSHRSTLADRGPHHDRVCTPCHALDPHPVDRWLRAPAPPARVGVDVSFALVDEVDLDYAGGAR